MSWQSWVEQEAENLGLRKSSGYRSPGAEARLGGPASSYHTRGSVAAPGALDIVGSSSGLTTLFNEIRQRFGQNINELFLNVPNAWQAIKGGASLSRNPEAGRPQHLHVALPGEAFRGLADRFLNSPLAGGGVESARAAAGPVAGCDRHLCAPAILGGSCVCWSDIWMYGIAVLLILWGGFMISGGAKRE